MENLIFFFFLFIIIAALSITNFIAFKLAKKDKQKRTLAGFTVLLLAPIVFFITGISVAPFDSGGFATGILMVSYGFLFAVNGIVIIIIGIFTKKAE